MRIQAIYAADFVTIFGFILKLHSFELKEYFFRSEWNWDSDVKMTENSSDWYASGLSCIGHNARMLSEIDTKADKRCKAKRLFC